MVDIIPLLDDQGAYGSKDNYGQRRAYGVRCTVSFHSLF
jgi:hypothetical protein